MTAVANIERQFRDALADAIELHPEGQGRFRIFTPFSFDDGDLVSPVLRDVRGRWELSDEGDTFMRLSYELDDRALEAEGRRKLIEMALSGGVEDRRGELVVPIKADGYGNALFSLVQAILRIMDVTVQSRAVVKSTFVHDVAAFVEDVVPADRRVKRWHDPERDPKGHHPVDWRVTTTDAPIFLFALTSENSVKDATITLHQFERWGERFRTVAIFENQEEIRPKTLARFTDVAEKSFSDFVGNRVRIAEYLRRALPANGAANN